MKTVDRRLLVEVEGGITAVPGFLASGVHAGIKKRKPDLALILAPRRAAAAATYTRNAVQAAPLQVTRRHLADGYARAVVVASGVANTCTGEAGLRDAEAMAVHTARVLGIDPADVIVASTGVIGPRLPMDRVEQGIYAAARQLTPDGGEAAARAIMTTDTRPKQAACRVALTGGDGDPAALVTVGGMAKGSGMIHPDMATMLAFLATDAAVEPRDLQAALRDAVDATFNLITVDGDTSPNDMVALLAAGTAGPAPLRPGTPAWSRFTDALTAVCASLARQIAADGEGARQTFGVRVIGAASVADARRAARAVASSNLVKTAVYGRDANWGRVVVAAGASGAAMVPEAASLRLCAGGRSLLLFDRGTPAVVDEGEASRLLAVDGVVFELDLGTGGPHEALAWGCDLTERYVEINAAYRT